MKKRYLFYILVLLMTLMLICSCGKADKNINTDTEKDTDRIKDILDSSSEKEANESSTDSDIAFETEETEETEDESSGIITNEPTDNDETDTSADTEGEADTENEGGTEVETETDTETAIETETAIDTETEVETSDTESSTETENTTEDESEGDAEITDTETESDVHVHQIGFIPAKAVTCTEDGYTETKMCSICKEVLVASVEIKATGHNWVRIIGVAPTCESFGLTDGTKCEKCGEVALKQEKIEALSHKWIVIPYKAPTCTSNGYTEGKECVRCGKALVERKKLPFADHKYIIHMPKAATCTEYGNGLYQSCSVCSYETSFERFPPVGHQYDENFVCTICQKDATTIQSLKFTLNEETNEYKLTGVDNPEFVIIPYEGIELKYPKIVIPSTYNGLPVTAIGKHAIALERPWDGTLLELVIPTSITYIERNAISQACLDIYYSGNIEDWCNITIENQINEYFVDSTYNLYIEGELLRELIIPASITEIKDYQFARCGSIERVIISEGVTTIGEYAFLGTYVLEIELPKSITTIKSGAFSGAYLEKINYLGDIKDWCNVTIEQGRYWGNTVTSKLYFSGELLNEVVIPSDVKEIKSNVFWGMPSIEKIIISEGVEKIAEKAFENCQSLISVTIPKSVNSIGANVFLGSGTEEIIYLGDINDWCNISFSKGSAFLLGKKKLYINDKLLTDLTIPSSVTKISDYAFLGYQYLKSITIENGVTEIGIGAFMTSINVASLNLPKSLTKIGDSAFKNCYELKNIELPNSIKEIGNDAFANCFFKNLILPSSIESIGSGAFRGNYVLEFAFVPSTIAAIDKNIFADCTNVRVFSDATERPSTWAEDWCTDVIHYWYSESEPKAEGNYWHYVDEDIYVW